MLEECGYINYILSDKTGTLTQNDLEFRSLAIGHSEYKTDIANMLKQTHFDIANQEVLNLFRCICLCHDVFIYEVNGKEELSGMSQDEIKLIQMCMDSKVIRIKEKTNETIILEVYSKKEGKYLDEVYKILKTFEFSSERRQMSILV